MPSFSFLKGTAKNNPQLDRDGSGSLDQESTEKARSRQSKRDYLRSLIKRASLATESKLNRPKSGQLSKPNPRQSTLSSPPASTVAATPMSDPNKPLPRPPAPGTPQAEEPPAKPTKKLERIISPIALQDLHKLFSGAPQFFARSEGHGTGAPHPSVAFPWDSELEIRDLCDHVQIHDDAWGCVTAWPHITVPTSRNTEATQEHHQKQKAHFKPRCRERPNMLSMQGIERGTIGYGAALELGVADALNEPEDMAGGPEAQSEHRRRFLNHKEGLRPLTDSTLIDQLVRVSETYLKDSLKHQRPTVELYTELFTRILYPPTTVTDSQDPYSLQVQIESLVHVLAAPYVWVDLSLVEWRIRLGQILWGSSAESDIQDEVAVNNEIMYEPATQKYWLLLQILLSCELLLRLDAISCRIEHGLEGATANELHRFEKEAKPSVRWSLILARQWMENIELVRMDPSAAIEKKPAPAGWLATLTGSSGNEVKPTESVETLNFRGRNQTQQLSGLVHFARKLGWPDLHTLTAKVSTNGISVSDSVQSTPGVGTPLSISTQRSSSYFANRRPGIRRGLSTQRSIAALIHPAGWLSNSYISGLVLPGEALSHFLISSLLEHDEMALSRIGDEANLYGGFIYCGKSFWSTACIAGRVLAARKGASECMGWISSDVEPKGASEGWVDIEVDLSLQNDEEKHAGKPRIWHKHEVETAGNVIGGADTSSVLPGDFVLPADESLQKPLTVNFESLDLSTATDSVHTSLQETPTSLSGTSDAPRLQSYSAVMKFAVEADGEARKVVNVDLAHDIQFVTAHPCVFSSHTEVLQSPTSPSFHESQSGSPGFPTATAGHPLHKAFTYTRIPILDLLSMPTTFPFSSLLSPPQSPDPNQSSTHTTSSSIPKVLVVDCTDSTMNHFPIKTTHAGNRHNFGSDLEMLARAVCAERGWNALVSRRVRGCLSCSVREASALGWRVVLRMA